MNNAKTIRELIGAGIVPKFLTSEEIALAMFETQTPNTLEAFGMLSAKHISKGLCKDLGVVSVQKVTQAFTQYLVDSLQDSATYPMDAFSYHASGTSGTAESNTDTALGAEVESRVSGTQVEGSSANIYQSVATITYTATRTIREHGLFSAASAGTLLDRSVVTDINVENTDQIEWTYQLTCNAEA